MTRTLRSRVVLLTALATIGLASVPVGGASAADAAVRSCSAGDVTAKQTGDGAGMSQPFVQVTVTNTSGSACALKGYPSITGMWTKSGKKALATTNGSLGNMSDPGPRRFILARGAHAWFAIGTATAYDPPLVTFRRVAFTVGSGASAGAAISLQATAPSGNAFPVGVTAWAPGVGRSDG